MTPGGLAGDLASPATARPGSPGSPGRGLVDFVDRHLAILFPLPAVLLVLLLMVYPLVYTVLMSTRSYDLTLRGFRTVALAHYLAVLTADRFWDAFGRTLIFTAMSVTGSIVVGMAMALVLNRDFRGARWARTAFLLPMVATPVATSLVWMMMFNPTLGVLNYFLRALGIPPSLWVADPRLAIPSIVLVDVWHFAPFAGLILLAGLRSLPLEPFESAMIDGATRVQTFLRITLPLLRPVLIIVLMFRTIDALKVFDLIWVITAGGPGFGSETLYVYAYNQAFKYLDLGYGSAVIVVFTLIVAGAALAWLRVRDRAWA